MWPAAVANHLNAGLPMIHHWAVHTWVRSFSNNAIVTKGVWTGPDDLSITLDGSARIYEGAMGGLVLDPIRYRVGTVIMSQTVHLALSPEGLEIIRGYNTRNAAIDVHCLCYNAADNTYLGARRFLKGYIDKSEVVTGAQDGPDTMSVDIVSIARKGEMTRTGKKSDQSQKMRSATDDFRKYADLGTVASDLWGNEPKDDD